MSCLTESDGCLRLIQTLEPSIPIQMLSCPWTRQQIFLTASELSRSKCERPLHFDDTVELRDTTECCLDPTMNGRKKKASPSSPFHPFLDSKPWQQKQRLCSFAISRTPSTPYDDNTQKTIRHRFIPFLPCPDLVLLHFPSFPSLPFLPFTAGSRNTLSGDHPPRRRPTGDPWHSNCSPRQDHRACRNWIRRSALHDTAERRKQKDSEGWNEGNDRWKVSLWREGNDGKRNVWKSRNGRK